MTGPVLITGATGFLGGHLARSWVELGREVRGLGRNVSRGADLERAGVRFLPVDLGDGPGLRAACEGAEIVVHAAALSTAWAPKAAFRHSNVDGTAAILEAAAAAGVRRFIHISTPAVLSRLADQFDLAECEPLPSVQTSRYGASKAAAERLVIGAPGLESVVVRPKAVYGRGDTALLPRLVAAGRSGRLRIVGDGDTVTHLTHVTDAVQAIMLVADCERPSGIYHVAGPETVRLWDVVARLLERLGHAPPTGQISIDRAMGLARLLEGVWRALRLGGEPPLTRYKVSVVAYSQTLDTSRARAELGFRPLVSVEEGLADAVAGHTDAGIGLVAPVPRRRREAGLPRRAAGIAVDVSFVVAGTVHPPAWPFERRWGRTALPVLVGVLRHPGRGVVLFDAGYGSTVPGNGSPLWALYRRLIRPRPAGLAETLRSVGVSLDDVTAVVLSHFDPDHCGGLIELPHAEVVCSAAAFRDVARRRAGSLRRRLLRGRVPPGLAGRVRLLDLDGSEMLDLFGDGSVEVISLGGHTTGHIGVRVTARCGTRYLLSGDAVLTLGRLESGSPPLAGIVDCDRRSAEWTRDRLRAAMRDDPGLVVVPSHCPDTADRLVGPEWRRPEP